MPKSIAQELTWQQDEAVSDLKRAMRENLPLIVKIRSGKDVPVDQVASLINVTENALSACAETGVPENFSFETTNYDDNVKHSFAIKQIKTELAKWKSVGKKSGEAKAKEAAAAENKSNEKQAQEKYQYVANNFISSFDSRAEYLDDQFVKKIQAQDPSAVSRLEDYGKIYLPTKMDLRDEFQKCLDAKIPDNFQFQFGSGRTLSMAQLKTLIPKWASIGETAAIKSDPSLGQPSLTVEQQTAKTMFENDFGSAMRSLEDVKRGQNISDFDYYQKWMIDPLKKSLAEAKRVKLPAGTLIGPVDPIPFSDAAAKAEKFEKELKSFYSSKDDPIAVFKNTQSAANLKRYDAFRAKYTTGLSGDKLRLMEEVLVNNVVYAQDPPQFLDQFFDVDKKKINNPAEFATAKIWATSNHTYSNTDVLKTDPHWRVYIWHFDGMKLVNTTSSRGSGTVAPAAEFRFQPK